MIENTMFLEDVKSLIDNDQKDKLIRFICNNKNKELTSYEWKEFTKSFYDHDVLKDAININGMGGCGIIKPNLSSVASMYVAIISEQKVVKTGSVSRRGVFGSTDFFYSIGLMDKNIRKAFFEKYNFLYLDYLEINPWKKYKKELALNFCIKKILENTLFLEYEANFLFLGLSDIEYYKRLNCKDIVNKPRNIHTYYSKIDDLIIDEIIPGKIFVDQVLFYEIESGGIPPIVSPKEVMRIDNDLLCGKCNDEFWKKALFYTVSILLFKLNYREDFLEIMEIVKDTYNSGKVFKALESVKFSYKSS